MVSETLLHVIVMTCVRIYSLSYGTRFLRFFASKFNMCLVVVALWFVGLALTSVTVTSATKMTYVVFYVGFTATGFCAAVTFFCTLLTDYNMASSNTTMRIRSYSEEYSVRPSHHTHATTTTTTRRKIFQEIILGRHSRYSPASWGASYSSTYRLQPPSYTSHWKQPKTQIAKR